MQQKKKGGKPAPTQFKFTEAEGPDKEVRNYTGEYTTELYRFVIKIACDDFDPYICYIMSIEIVGKVSATIDYVTDFLNKRIPYPSINAPDFRRNDADDSIYIDVEAIKKTLVIADKLVIDVSEQIDLIAGKSTMGGTTRKPYEKCTIKELKEKAKNRKVTGYSSMTKASLIAALRTKKM